MSMQFEVKEHEAYLELVCTGVYSLDEAQRIYEQAFALATAAWRAGVLVDVRQLTGNEPPLIDRYEMAVRVSELQAKRSPPIRFAMLGNEPMIHPQRFGQVVATNRGAVVGVFSDEAMAVKWLAPKPKST